MGPRSNMMFLMRKVLSIRAANRGRSPMRTERIRWSLAARALGLAAVSLATATAAQAEPAAKARKAPEPTAAQVQAREILMRMAAYPGGAEKYSVSLRAGYDAVQTSG